MAIIFREGVEPRLYEEHLLRLDAEDRYMRFGNRTSDDSIKKYVSKISKTDYLSGYMSSINGILIAGVHLGVFVNSKGTKIAELGISVDKEYRGKSYTHDLIARALDWAKWENVDEFHSLCLPANSAMKRAASRHGFKLATEDGFTVGKIVVEKPGFMEKMMVVPNTWYKHYYEIFHSYNDFLFEQLVPRPFYWCGYNNYTA